MRTHTDPISFLAISDDERSDVDDAVVKSDIAPKRGRGRKSYKEPEILDDDEEMADVKNTNGDAEEDDDDEQGDEDLEEDEYDPAPPYCLFVLPLTMS